MRPLVLGVVAALSALVVGDAAHPGWPLPGRQHPAGPSVDLSALLGAARRAVDHLQPARRRRRRDAQLPDALERLSSSIRAGRSLAGALVDLAGELPGPLGEELRPIAGALRHGAAVPDALAAWAARRDASPAVRLVAAALMLSAEGGGEIAHAVDRVAATLRERREVEGEVRALATQATASAVVLAVAPLVFAVLVASVEPGVVTFLATNPVGLGCLVAGLVLDGLGARWMARITGAAR